MTIYALSSGPGISGVAVIRTSGPNTRTIIEKLTNIGLEVESFENQQSEHDEFVIAKIVNAERHPNADRLSVCDVDIGEKEIVKVVCGAPNAKKDLLTIYAPPGAIIPKNKMKLSVSKIRGVTSYGMLCSESELKLSDESEGIIELPSNCLLYTSPSPRD